MKVTNLTKNQIRELVRRWHYRQYAASSFRASPFAFAQIIEDDVQLILPIMMNIKVE